MSMTKREYEKWLDSLPDDDREPDDRARVEGPEDALPVRERGQDHHGDVPVRGRDGGRGRHPVDVGHGQVHEDQIGVRPVRLQHAFFAVLRFDDFITLGA